MSKILWQNKIRKITVQVIESMGYYSRRFLVVVIHDTINHVHVDYPIQYESGIIAYDFPERIPKYAKSLISKAFKQKRLLDIDKEGY